MAEVANVEREPRDSSLLQSKTRRVASSFLKLEGELARIRRHDSFSADLERCCNVKICVFVRGTASQP